MNPSRLPRRRPGHAAPSGHLLALRWFGPNFPYGTLLINITGSAVMGLVTGYLAARNVPSPSFDCASPPVSCTTFSTFSLDTIALWERG